MLVPIDTAYTWLRRTDRSAMRRSIQVLVSQMWERVEANEAAAAVNLQARLERLTRRAPDEGELAEVMVESGLALFVLGRWEEAAQKFQAAVYRYGFRTHPRAVAQWLLGYVLWLLPGREEEAILAWQTSIDKFQQMSRRKLLPKGEGDWYRDQATNMEASLQAVLQALQEHQSPLPASGSPELTDTALGWWQAVIDEPIDLDPAD